MYYAPRHGVSLTATTWQTVTSFPTPVDGVVKLTYSGLEAVFTLWALSTVDKGGLDWSVVEIGQVRPTSFNHPSSPSEFVEHRLEAERCRGQERLSFRNNPVLPKRNQSPRCCVLTFRSFSDCSSSFRHFEYGSWWASGVHGPQRSTYPRERTVDSTELTGIERPVTTGG